MFTLPAARVIQMRAVQEVIVCAKIKESGKMLLLKLLSRHNDVHLKLIAFKISS